MKLIIGDDAVNINNSRIESIVFQGLPIWDIELILFLEEALTKDYEKIYLSCSHPLAGNKKKKQIFKLSTSEAIEFKKEERGFYSGKERYFLKEKEILDLCECFFNKLKAITELDYRIVLIPIKILWHEKIKKSRLNMPPIYDRIINNFEALDFESILSTCDFRNQYGLLSKKGISKITGIL